MSRKRRANGTTYALVFWTETNEISVLDARCVIDQAMLRDPDKEGMVEFGEPSITAPPSGWPRFRARVLAVADNEVELRRMEDDFIENGTMSFNTTGQETNNNTTPTTTSKRKRQKSAGGPSSKSSTDSNGGYETRTKRNISLDKQELLQRISVLESQLKEEQTKNEQLLRLNLQLQEGLPKLIEETLTKKSLPVSTEVKEEAERMVENKPIPETSKVAGSTNTITTTKPIQPPPALPPPLLTTNTPINTANTNGKSSSSSDIVITTTTITATPDTNTTTIATTNTSITNTSTSTSTTITSTAEMIENVA